MPQNILITGAGGMLGRDMAEIFAKDRKYKVFGTIRKRGARKPKVNYIKVDLRNTKELKKILSNIKPDIIIHCAALVNVDTCEKNKKDANVLHVEATKILSSYKKGGVRFVYISTDSVFNGKRGNYTELDQPDPLNYYALSKLKGEKTAMTTNKNSIIIRTNIYGFHVPPGNSLAEWALYNLTAKRNINGFTDVYFNPLYTKQLSKIIKHILEKMSITGILNVGTKKPISKYVFLKLLASNFKTDRTLIKPISMDNASGPKAIRPKNTTLNIGKLNKILDGKIPETSAGLAELKRDYLKIFKNHDHK